MVTPRLNLSGLSSPFVLGHSHSLFSKRQKLHYQVSLFLRSSKLKYLHKIFDYKRNHYLSEADCFFGEGGSKRSPALDLPLYSLESG